MGKKVYRNTMSQTDYAVADEGKRIISGDIKSRRLLGIFPPTTTQRKNYQKLLAEAAITLDAPEEDLCLVLRMLGLDTWIEEEA